MNLNIPGAITLLVVIAGMLIEITPIHVSPLAWLGRRINRDTNEKVDKINSDLQEHIADDMRSYILSFQKQCINGEHHTQEDFRRAYNMCDKYENYITTNKLKNSEADDAIHYIRTIYPKLLEDGTFFKV